MIKWNESKNKTFTCTKPLLLTSVDIWVWQEDLRDHVTNIERSISETIKTVWRRLFTIYSLPKLFRQKRYGTWSVQNITTVLYTSIRQRIVSKPTYSMALMSPSSINLSSTKLKIWISAHLPNFSCVSKYSFNPHSILR